MKVLEVTAQMYQMIRAMNCQYQPISQENIEKMQYFVCHCYGQDCPEPTPPAKLQGSDAGRFEAADSLF